MNKNYSFLLQDILSLLNGFSINKSCWPSLSYNKYVLKRALNEQDKMDDALLMACYDNNIQLVNILIELDTNNKMDYNIGLTNACASGHKKIIDIMIQHGANDWDFSLTSACSNNHRDIAELMINHGADINRGLMGACGSGNKEMINFLIKRSYPVELNWSLGLSIACDTKHKNKFKHMFNASANYQDIIDFMIKKGAFACFNCNFTEH